MSQLPELCNPFARRLQRNNHSKLAGACLHCRRAAMTHQAGLEGRGAQLGECEVCQDVVVYGVRDVVLQVLQIARNNSISGNL